MQKTPGSPTRAARRRSEPLHHHHHQQQRDEDNAVPSTPERDQPSTSRAAATRRLNLSNSPLQVQDDDAEPNVFALYDMFSHLLNAQDQQRLQDEILKLEDRYITATNGIWHDIENNAAKITILTRGNKAFSVKGKNYVE
ncbi:unnamed protein product [Oikopleura dioica]|uniref:Uncharacterized protein n=1 Tax=Oikopleura dioica TaxID=34765 RepID=E4YGY5_OIKDI|nr:unnamed protein product [Oikopleura dioica]